MVKTNILKLKDNRYLIAKDAHLLSLDVVGRIENHNNKKFILYVKNDANMFIFTTDHVQTLARTYKQWYKEDLTEQEIKVLEG